MQNIKTSYQSQARRKLVRICNPDDGNKTACGGVQETIREWFLRLLFCSYVVSFTLGTPNFRHSKFQLLLFS